MAHVLVVDDSPAIRALLAARLRASGHEVEEAPDAAVAMDKAMTTVPDVVVTDLVMAGLSGGQLCRLLRSEANDVPRSRGPSDRFRRQAVSASGRARRAPRGVRRERSRRRRRRCIADEACRVASGRRHNERGPTRQPGDRSTSESRPSSTPHSSTRSSPARSGRWPTRGSFRAFSRASSGC